MSNLYELTTEYRMLLDMLEEEELDDQVLNDTMEAIHGELEVKADGYVKVIRQLEADVEALEREADFYSNKAKTTSNNIKKLKDALCKALILTGNEKGLKAGQFTLKVAGNGGKKPLRIIGEVPDGFKKIVLEVDNGKIREALESGVDLDFAYLEERGKHLAIK